MSGSGGEKRCTLCRSVRRPRRRHLLRRHRGSRPDYERRSLQRSRLPGSCRRVGE
jgi:hypothetical protein